jgi:hypothetical protein
MRLGCWQIDMKHQNTPFGDLGLIAAPRVNHQPEIKVTTRLLDEP